MPIPLYLVASLPLAGALRGTLAIQTPTPLWFLSNPRDSSYWDPRWDGPPEPRCLLPRVGYGFVFTHTLNPHKPSLTLGAGDLTPRPLSGWGFRTQKTSRALIPWPLSNGGLNNKLGLSPWPLLLRGAFFCANDRCA